MLIRLRHKNGKEYTMEVNQVVVYTDDGKPCAMAYTHGGLIIHTDVTKDSFLNDITSLNVKDIDPNG